MMISTRSAKLEQVGHDDFKELVEWCEDKMCFFFWGMEELFIVEEDNVLDNYEDEVGCFGDDSQNHWNHFWCLGFFIA